MCVISCCLSVGMNTTHMSATIPKVYWYYGKRGSGKSRAIFNNIMETYPHDAEPKGYHISSDFDLLRYTGNSGYVVIDGQQRDQQVIDAFNAVKQLAFKPPAVFVASEEHPSDDLFVGCDVVKIVHCDRSGMFPR